MTQQEFNTKHHKTIWHIRHTVWRLQSLYGKFKPCWVPYFCKMMMVLKVYPYTEVKQVCEMLKDAIESDLMENPGLTWEGDVAKLEDVNVPFDVFLDERFGPLGNAASSEAKSRKVKGRQGRDDNSHGMQENEQLNKIAAFLERIAIALEKLTRSIQ